MAIDTIKSTAVLDGTIATADIADDAVTSAKLDTNISVDGNLGLGTSVSTRKLNVNAGSYGHILLDTANAAHGLQILGQANAQANSGFDIQYAASTGLKVRTLAVQPLSLQTSASAGSPSDRLHIHTNGIVSIPQGIELGSGVDATAANVLDDYEEGTFTPTLIDSGDDLNTNYTFQAGQYTKVGNKVTFALRINSNSHDSDGDQLYIGGLPFAINFTNTSNRSYVPVDGSGLNLDTGSGYYKLVGQLTNTNQSITLLQQGDLVAQNNFRANNLAQTKEIYISGTYFTNS